MGMTGSIVLNAVLHHMQQSAAHGAHLHPLLHWSPQGLHPDVTADSHCRQSFPQPLHHQAVMLTGANCAAVKSA